MPRPRCEGDYRSEIGRDRVDDLGRHLVHAVLVARVGRDLLQDLVVGLALERGSQPGTIAPHLNSFIVRSLRRWDLRRRRPRLGAGAPAIRSRDVPRARVSRGADLAGARALRDRQLPRPPVLQPADDGDVPQPRRLRHGRLGPALGRGRGSVHLPGDDAAGLRPQPAQPGRQARADVPDRPRPRRHPQRATRWSRRRTCTRSASTAREVALAHNGHLREFARMRYDLHPARPARAGAAHRGDDRLRVDLRAGALPARGPLRRCRRRASSPTPRRPRCASCARSGRSTGSTPPRP